MMKKSEQETMLRIWKNNPVLFFQQAMSFEPDEWQIEVANALVENGRVAVKSGQGVGKTGLTANTIFWFLTCFYKSKVVCTAPTQQQLKDVLWSELAKWHNKSLIKNFYKLLATRLEIVNDGSEWFATMRTATKPENMQGFHADNLLFVVDEGSGVDREIFEVIEGTLSGSNNKLLVLGNPTKTDGYFYDIFNGSSTGWSNVTVSSRDSKRTNKKNIARLDAKYGKDSNVVRVRVDGLFPKNTQEKIISLETVEKAMGLGDYREPLMNMSEVNSNPILNIGVDVARKGDDRSTIAIMRNDYYYEVSEYNQVMTNELSGIVLNTVRQYLASLNGIEKVYIKVDETGVGGGVVDMLQEQAQEQSLFLGVKIEVYGVNNGGTSQMKQQYKNIISELWGTMGETLMHNFMLKEDEFDIIRLPQISELKAELSDRNYKFDSKGRIMIESKDELKERGNRSPDYADAIMLASYTPPSQMLDISNRY